MSVFNSIILGIIQGLTEFLPVSSSGHLIIARDIFGWHNNIDLSFDAVLQLATVLAIIVFFWKDIWILIREFINLIQRKPVEEKNKTLIYAIILGTIPAIITGVLLERYMETTFRSVILVSVILLLGSAVMFFAEKLSKKDKKLTIKRGFYIGLFQCLALIPGFSRSGATISGGLFNGLNREEAARFSFLLSIPIILGSGLKKLLDIWKGGSIESDYLNLLFGSISAFIVGLIVIKFLMDFLKKHSLNFFIIYRIVLAILVLFIML
jgi:undecaprenyl-diphosphatase